MCNKILYFLVEDFSNATRESFFEKELPALSEKFSKIYIIPLYPDGTPLSYKSKNIEVIDFDFFQSCNRLKLFISNFFTVFYVLSYEIIHTHDKKFYFRNFLSNLNMLLYKYSASKNFENIIKKDINSDTVFYTYWFSQWTFAMSLMKFKYPQLKLVSRIHGADYNEMQIKKVLPFRYFQHTKVDRLFPVSESAAEYVSNKFNYPKNRIAVSRLGLFIEKPIASVDASRLNILSCSSVIPLKRVHLIVEILKNIKEPCHWVHFGDGPLLEDLVKAAQKLPVNCTYEFKGYVSNNSFVSFISENPQSLMINVSESEGIPVSMMECIAVGLPIMGTNVGGVDEIIKEQTGYLLDVDFQPLDVANLIENIHNEGKIYTQDFRQKVMMLYYDLFFAPKNHNYLAEKLLTI